MIPQEMQAAEIRNYCTLQRIKADNGGHENMALDYEIKASAALLATLGINVEDLTLKK